MSRFILVLGLLLAGSQLVSIVDAAFFSIPATNITSPSNAGTTNSTANSTTNSTMNSTTNSTVNVDRRIEVLEKMGCLTIAEMLRLHPGYGQLYDVSINLCMTEEEILQMMENHHILYYGAIVCVALNGILLIVGVALTIARRGGQFAGSVMQYMFFLVALGPLVGSSATLFGYQNSTFGLVLSFVNTCVVIWATWLVVATESAQALPSFPRHWPKWQARISAYALTTLMAAGGVVGAYFFGLVGVTDDSPFLGFYMINNQAFQSARDLWK